MNIEIWIIGRVFICGIIVAMIWKAGLKKWAPLLKAILGILLIAYVIGGGRFINIRDWWYTTGENKKIGKTVVSPTQMPTPVPEPVGMPISTSDSDIVQYALQFVGNPYVWGGSSLTEGCDCSHFVWLVLLDTGYYDGEYVQSTFWAEKGEPVEGGLANAQAGDVIVYDFGSYNCGHVAIYDGNGLIIEAKGSAYGITHDRAPDEPKRPIIGIRRFSKLN